MALHVIAGAERQRDGIDQRLPRGVQIIRWTCVSTNGLDAGAALAKQFGLRAGQNDPKREHRH
jgi:hypothetical protein